MERPGDTQETTQTALEAENVSVSPKVDSHCSFSYAFLLGDVLRILFSLAGAEAMAFGVPLVGISIRRTIMM